MAVMGPDIAMRPVASSAIAAAGYDPATRRLRVRYLRGATWDYQAVPAAEYAAFLAAPSKGGFVNAVIKRRYRGERVD